MNESTINASLKAMPVELREPVEKYLLEFRDKCSSLNIDFPSDEKLLHSLCKVWASSRFVAETCVRDPNILTTLITTSDIFSCTARSKYRHFLKNAGIDSEISLMQKLRKFRKMAMIRIAWRDIAGWADLSETLEDLSLLAEVCIQVALDFLYEEACKNMDIPLLANGSPQNMVVLAMGKLGAWELNFSSDIDLIFTFPEDGVLPDEHGTTYSEFFLQLSES